MPDQKPSLGGIVLVPMAPNENNGSDVAPAIVVRVWSDTTVNVRIFRDNETEEWRTSAVYIDELPDEESREALGTLAPNRWTWPPRV